MHRSPEPARKPSARRSPGWPGRAEADLNTVNAFAISLLQQTTLEELLWSMVDNIGRLLGYEDCAIYLCEGDRIVQSAAYGVHAPQTGEFHQPLVLRPGEGIVGSVAQTGVALIVRDTRLDPRYVAEEFPGRSELTVPILFEGRVLGVIDTEHREPERFDESDRDRLQWIANIAASRLATALAERERLKAEAALSRVHGELEAAKLESLGTLAGGIAHDFNNLLTVILGNVNLAQRFVAEAPASPDSREKRVLDAAHEACLRARDLTKQLLIFASGGAPIKRTGSIADLLRESVEFALHGSNVKAELDIAGGLHRVDMDAGQIHSVLNSLVLNAIQAMPSGGVIRVAAANGDGPCVVVEVEDHGCGIPEKILDKIFDPYFTTKGSKNSGLGLTTAYRIVKEHGGTLGVRSEVGAGTTFEIRLPAAAELPAETREKKVSPTAHQEGGHVLLMDDDESVRKSVAQMLVHLGHRVTVARHGEEALSLFSDAHSSGRPFSAVILDLTIPGGMGGKDVIPKLRDIEPGVKAIVASGYSNDPVMSAHETYGFQAVIEKPFDLAELDQVLSRLIA